MRAKKMTARKHRLPTADALRARFIEKGTEITRAESEELLERVREHRVTKRASGKATGKPKPKREISAPTPRRTYSGRYG